MTISISMLFRCRAISRIGKPVIPSTVQLIIFKLCLLTCSHPNYSIFTKHSDHKFDWTETSFTSHFQENFGIILAFMSPPHKC